LWKEYFAMAADNFIHGDGGPDIFGHGQNGNAAAVAARFDSGGLGVLDLQVAAAEQSAALHQLLDEVFAGLYESDR
jgi:hypothetical protein